jgi:hypothetical protein
MAMTLAPATGRIWVSVTTPVSAPVVTPWANAPVNGVNSSASRITVLRAKHGAVAHALVRSFIQLSKHLEVRCVDAAGRRQPNKQ